MLNIIKSNTYHDFYNLKGNWPKIDIKLNENFIKYIAKSPELRTAVKNIIILTLSQNKESFCDEAVLDFDFSSNKVSIKFNFLDLSSKEFNYPSEYQDTLSLAEYLFNIKQKYKLNIDVFKTYALDTFVKELTFYIYKSE